MSNSNIRSVRDRLKKRVSENQRGQLNIKKSESVDASKPNNNREGYVNNFLNAVANKPDDKNGVVGNLHDNIANSNNNGDKWEELENLINKKLDGYVKKNTEHVATIKEILTKIEKIKEKLKENHGLSAKTEKIQKELEDCANEKEKLNGQLESQKYTFEETIKDQENKINDINTQNISQQKKNEELEKELNKYQEATNNHKKTIDDLNKLIDEKDQEIQQKIANLITTISEKDDTINGLGLEEQLSSLYKEINDLITTQQKTYAEALKSNSTPGMVGSQSDPNLKTSQEQNQVIPLPPSIENTNPSPNNSGISRGRNTKGGKRRGRTTRRVKKAGRRRSTIKKTGGRRRTIKKTGRRGKKTKRRN
jgi:uncharacterized protein (DUF3084 family)